MSSACAEVVNAEFCVEKPLGFPESPARASLRDDVDARSRSACVGCSRTFASSGEELSEAYFQKMLSESVGRELQLYYVVSDKYILE
eukprot:9655216-Lingulodinium_polyedra.AAC.1